MDTNLEQQELIVELKNNKRTCHVSLLLKTQKVILSELTETEHCLFQEKLPITKAIVLGLSTENGQLFFAQKEIQIGQDRNVQLDLQPIKKEAMQKTMEVIDAGYE